MKNQFKLQLHKICNREFAIQNWPEFISKIDETFDKVRLLDEGDLASYIPQLSKQDRNWFGVSLCTVDGQI